MYSGPVWGDKAVANNEQASTWWLRDMSFLRLKNLELGYTLPQRWTTKIGIRGCRLFAKRNQSADVLQLQALGPRTGNYRWIEIPTDEICISGFFSINFNN